MHPKGPGWKGEILMFKKNKEQEVTRTNPFIIQLDLKITTVACIATFKIAVTTSRVSFLQLYLFMPFPPVVRMSCQRQTPMLGFLLLFQGRLPTIPEPLHELGRGRGREAEKHYVQGDKSKKPSTQEKGCYLFVIYLSNYMHSHQINSVNICSVCAPEKLSLMDQEKNIHLEQAKMLQSDRTGNRIAECGCCQSGGYLGMGISHLHMSLVKHSLWPNFTAKVIAVKEDPKF